MIAILLRSDGSEYGRQTYDTDDPPPSVYFDEANGGGKITKYRLLDCSGQEIERGKVTPTIILGLGVRPGLRLKAL